MTSGTCGRAGLSSPRQACYFRRPSAFSDTRSARSSWRPTRSAGSHVANPSMVWPGFVCYAPLADRPILMLALHHHVLVIDLDELVLSITGEDEQALEDAPNVEIDNYRVIARRPEGWDALSTIVHALDERHPDLIRRILERLWRAYSEWIWD